MPKGERTPLHAVASGCRVPVVASGAIRSRRSGLTYTGMGPVTMMDMKLNAERIRTLREQRAWSQEHLATVAGLSTRTLQRIENGRTEPRGQTLRLLAKALDTPVEEFLDFTKEEDTGFLQLLNLSALSFWVLPLGNIFIPLALWVMKREKIGVRRWTSNVSLVVTRSSPVGATAWPASLRVKAVTFSSICSASADISSPAGVRT